MSKQKSTPARITHCPVCTLKLKKVSNMRRAVCEDCIELDREDQRA